MCAIRFPFGRATARVGRGPNMRANNILGLAAIAAGLTLVAGAAIASGEGQSQNQRAIGGPGTKYYPTVEAMGSGPVGTRSSPVADYRQGVTALRAGKYRDAIASFDRALVLAPGDSNTWTMLGLAKEGDNDLSGARAAYEKAIGRNGGNIPARQRLGVTEAKLGQMDQAQAELVDLQKRSTACGRGCTDGVKLKTAIAAIGDAIAHGPVAAAPKG
jgi:tetratricopeptide (TPR) repeat protein